MEDFNHEQTLEETNFQPPTEMIHGMKVVTETPEVVSRGLELLRTRMQVINAYFQAQGQPSKVIPEDILTDDKYLTKFLRVMKFDPRRTAKLLTKHWEFKVDVLKLPKKRWAAPPFFLNPPFLLRSPPTPLLLRCPYNPRISAFDVGKELLESQIMVILPGRDKVGRRTLLIQPKNIDYTKFQREDVVKLAWYTLEQATYDDEATQKFGVISLNDPSGASISNFDRGAVSMIMVGGPSSLAL